MAAKKSKVNYKLVITTYSQLVANVRHSDEFQNFSWHFVWLDEGHHIKNAKIIIYAQCQALIRQFSVIITDMFCSVVLY